MTLDAAPLLDFNRDMAQRIPRTLTAKRAALAFERTQLKARLSQIETELQALDFALKVVSPTWAPPKRVSRPQKRTLLPRGQVASTCLQLLRKHGEMPTPELARVIATQFSLKFADKAAEQDFASSVAMALRRYQRQGIVEVVGKDEKTGALRWSLCRGEDGRLLILARAA